MTALIKNEVSHPIVTHCVEHQWELAANNATKPNTFMQEMQDLYHIYKLYHYSPKTLQDLKDIGKALDQNILMSVNLGGTRWLPTSNEHK